MKYLMLGLPCFFILGGFVLLAIGMFLKNKIDNMKSRCTQKVMAKITKITYGSGNFDDSMNLCYYWYGYTINGKEYNTKAKYMIRALKYKVGDDVEILCNPNDFNDMYNPNDMGKHSHKLVLGLGIESLITGIIVIIISFLI